MFNSLNPLLSLAVFGARPTHFSSVLALPIKSKNRSVPLRCCFAACYTLCTCRSLSPRSWIQADRKILRDLSNFSEIAFNATFRTPDIGAPLKGRRSCVFCPQLFGGAMIGIKNSSGRSWEQGLFNGPISSLRPTDVSIPERARERRSVIIQTSNSRFAQL